MAPDARLLKETLAHVEARADQVTLHFYARLFHERPELRELFPAAMDGQRDRFFRALLEIVQGAERIEFLTGYLAQLGRDHRKYGVTAEHYAAVGRALLGALRDHVGEAWTREMEQEWQATYQFAAARMIEAAEEDAARNPAWWVGEVVAHERRTGDIAVVTLRPDPYLPYRPGQYVSVETPRWPRVWRLYSVANAPRRDGLIELHVRAVGAGWVSSALVYHTQVGDKLRLGPARGSLVLDSESRRPVLCVGGGTGLAPLRALAEELARSDPERPLHLFFGARTEPELYDLAALSDLSTRHPRLVVVAAVSEGASRFRDRGTVGEVATRYGRWDNHDVYVAGSSDMVRATTGALQEQGVAFSRIRFDEFS